MKLFAKTSLYYLFAGLPAFIIAGSVCYWMISTEVKERNFEDLETLKGQVEKYLTVGDSNFVNYLVQNKEAAINKIENLNTRTTTFSDTLIYNSAEDEFELNHLLTSYVHTNNGDYSLLIWKKTLEKDEFLEGLLMALIIILFCFFAYFFIINWYLSKTLWKPFYHTLKSLKSFHPNESNNPSPEKTSIKEFNELNVSVYTMMDKMITDFKSQKQFTENAAHELQTPLAVIKSKIDLLIQSSGLTQADSELINAIGDATSKLTRINKSLLLLAKIKNQQFKIAEYISINKVLDESLQLFSELIQSKKLIVSKTIESETTAFMNADLCLILINNLLQNAIKHNFQNGIIEIYLDQHELTFSNSGKVNSLQTVSIFERFHKNSTDTDSIGLGLAIAKEIAEVSNFDLIYKYEFNKHVFTLLFKS